MKNLTRTELKTELKALRTKGYTDIKLSVSTEALRNEYTRLKSVFPLLSDMSDEHTQEFEDEETSQSKPINTPVFEVGKTYLERNTGKHLTCTYINGRMIELTYDTENCGGGSSTYCVQESPDGSKVVDCLNNIIYACDEVKKPTFEVGCWYQDEDGINSPLKCAEIKSSILNSSKDSYVQFENDPFYWLVYKSEKGEYIVHDQGKMYATDKTSEPLFKIGKKYLNNKNEEYVECTKINGDIVEFTDSQGWEVCYCLENSALGESAHNFSNIIYAIDEKNNELDLDSNNNPKSTMVFEVFEVGCYYARENRNRPPVKCSKVVAVEERNYTYIEFEGIDNEFLIYNSQKGEYIKATGEFLYARNKVEINKKSLVTA